jgi:hypothetical protein
MALLGPGSKMRGPDGVRGLGSLHLPGFLAQRMDVGLKGVAGPPDVIYDFSAMGIWFDPSDVSTLSTLANGAGGSPSVGGDIGSVRNKGTAGGYFNAGGTKPTLQRAANGRLYASGTESTPLTFGQTSQDNVILGKDFNCVAGLLFPAQGEVLDGSGADNNGLGDDHIHIGIRGNGTVAHFNNFNSGHEPPFTNGPGPGSGLPHVMEWRYQGGSKYLTADRVALTTGSGEITLGYAPHRFFGSLTSANGYQNRLYGVVIKQSAMTTQERLLVTEWLARQTSATLL